MRKIKLHTQILIGMLLGVIIGIIFQEKAVIIKPIGTIFIRLITMVVVPLVFVSLFIGTASLGDIKKLGRIGLKAFLYFFITTAIAISVGVTLANVVKPGRGLPDEVQAQLLKNYQQEKIFDFGKLEERPSLIQTLVNIVPTNPVKALAEGNMLQIIFLAIIFGIAVTLIKKEKAKTVIDFFDGFNDTIIQIVHIVMRLAPYGVLALIAAVVGEFGIDILLPLLKYSLVVVSGLFIYTLSVNSLTVGLIGRFSPIKFFKNYRPAMLIAFSTSSSNAALPIAMECVQEKMNVSREVTSFVLPLGATINMDGTALYQGVAAIFIAQIYGMNLGIVQQLTIILTATLASVGAAGVPGAGIITLAMVLQAINVPLEGIALILGVDRILDMLRTTTNIIGDAAGAVVVNSTEKLKK
ncbi:dicarboxylate/amino acid:cation symporter [Candidatus Aminicenantes bacterium AC-708-M15]|jgi:Na+/H+-dicarboxylate symporter|nr:dicarboxylate/amino acid:cation symporter [SCandidatus Aminicenantes bacterium Aminicenantia_JdfR_composite]MCP2596371.1 dicarboxylate/amino acid:cation symporter [Candidatus Aminicenantes bacterium AC-335-G13]MCP2604100.1 dicarboxylate/amino acid:cation symporter [Candidatus Aminicenantes bacterium AC-708-M15]MCP2605389.1 dicarboxylate/amino acid:cation symporter [Candidatus Aminicenantes bacterium AC-335-O07]MCP2606000.1 dicarboxylate/amino acid:cation symporter [Candidatus Aminicenantes b